MIKDFTDKEFIEEMKRRFVVPQWYTREQIFENIKNYNEELNDKSIDNIIDNVKRNMYQCVDELVESYVENYKEEEERYYCCDCGVELDRVRDGEEKPDFRCNNCYWEDKEGIDSKNIITPDYRKQEEEEEEEEEK